MAFSSGNRRSESGAQLLARLSTRPEVKGVDSFIFEKGTSSCQIIELYGMEGTGKSEIALQCSARVCLPSSWNGVLLSGLQAKVIYIDTDSKFSILRLAVVLEKQILEMLKSNSARKSKPTEVAVNEESFTVNFENFHHTQVFPRDSKEDDLLCAKAGLENQVSLIKDETDTSTLPVLKKRYSGNMSRDINDDCNTRLHSSLTQSQSAVSNDFNNSEHKNKSKTFHENVTSASNVKDALHVFSPEELEEIVQDSLSRLQVLRPSNSQQLLSSLLSLETVLMEDTLYTLVIIDSISAFYWLDRLASPNSYQHLDSRMAPIAKVLKKYASEFGVTCLITKSAFFMGKKRPDHDHTTLADDLSKTDKCSEPYMYNEYLGKIWSSLNMKRIMLTFDVFKTGDIKVGEKTTNEVKKIRAYCTLSETVKQYIFKDDLLVPDTSVQSS